VTKDLPKAAFQPEMIVPRHEKTNGDEEQLIGAQEESPLWGDVRRSRMGQG
jgi:hypothetical protein